MDENSLRTQLNNIYHNSPDVDLRRDMVLQDRASRRRKRFAMKIAAIVLWLISAWMIFK